MPKLMLKLIYNLRGRGVKAPALLAFPNLLLRRFGRATRGQAFAGAGVIVAAVAVVSFLTWLNDAHKPLVRSIEEAVERSLPETLEQVDDQVATLLGVDEETVRHVREGLAETASGIARIANAGSLTSVGSDTLLTPSSATPEQSSSQPSTDETSPPPATEDPLPATEEPPPATSEPTPPTSEEPPPVTEEPPPATENPPPATEEPSPAPPGEAPPATDEPPTTDQPAPPPLEEPSPAPEVPLPKAGEPPPV